MNKKIILGIFIIVSVCGLAYATYSFSAIDNNPVNTTDSLTKKNITDTKINSTTDDNKVNNDNQEKATKKYYCRQCDKYHSKPVKQYHRYGNCPICGKYVDTQKVSHTHDTTPYYKEEPREDS